MLATLFFVPSVRKVANFFFTGLIPSFKMLHSLKKENNQNLQLSPDRPLLSKAPMERLANIFGAELWVSLTAGARIEVDKTSKMGLLLLRQWMSHNKTTQPLAARTTHCLGIQE